MKIFMFFLLMMVVSCASVPCDCEERVEETRVFFLTLTADDARALQRCGETMQEKAHQSAIETNRKLLGR